MPFYIEVYTPYAFFVHPFRKFVQKGTFSKNGIFLNEFRNFLKVFWRNVVQKGHKKKGIQKGTKKAQVQKKIIQKKA